MPPPAVAHLVGAMGLDGGIVISASHNAFHYNGLKFLGAGGHKLSDAREADIESLAPIASAESRYPAGSKYYTVPITFTIEIIDQSKPGAPDQSARAGGAEGQNS